MSASAKEVLVLGGGFAGLTAANVLQKHAGRGVNITLIDKRQHYVFGSAIIDILCGERTKENIKHDIGRISTKNIKFVCDEVVKLNVEANIVKTRGNKELKYDYMMIAVGAEQVQADIPRGRYIYNLYDPDAAFELSFMLRQFRSGSILLYISGSQIPYPPAPYEAALVIDDVLRQANVRGSSTITIATSEARVLDIFGEDISSKVAALLSSRGIEVITNSEAEQVLTEEKRLRLSNGDSIRYDILIFIPKHKAPSFLSSTNLLDDGWLRVESRTMQTEQENIFAAGDVVDIKASQELPLPKSGTLAEKQAMVAANNILSCLRGSGSVNEFDGSAYFFMRTSMRESAYIDAEFYAQPKPSIKFSQPSWFTNIQRRGFEEVRVRNLLEVKKLSYLDRF